MRKNQTKRLLNSRFNFRTFLSYIENYWEIILEKKKVNNGNPFESFSSDPNLFDGALIRQELSSYIQKDNALIKKVVTRNFLSEGDYVETETTTPINYLKD